ncbi:MAG: cation diffusion facilitator family transporter, partial [Gemmiger sp.]|nr:cation diffusion facilitator family transporter [Gemmiger sp.]
MDIINALLSRFVPQAADTRSHAGRAAIGRFASVVGIGCNAVLFAAKLAIGLLSGSLSIAADAVNNLSDASSSVISLLGFKMGAKPADAEHPYGHGRYEYLAGLSVAVLIMVIGVELLKSSIDKILAPTPVQFTVWTVVVLGFSILLKGWMMAFNHKMGLRIHSETLLATAADSRNDVITTAAVLAAALLSRWTGVELDGWMGLAVAVFILCSGFGLVRDTLDPLLGRAPDEDEVQEIRKAIMAYPGVMGTHDLLIHDYGPGRQFASVHVEMRADADPLRTHAVVDGIERDFMRERGLNLVVHMDPMADVNTALG